MINFKRNMEILKDFRRQKENQFYVPFDFKHTELIRIFLNEVAKLSSVWFQVSVCVCVCASNYKLLFFFIFIFAVIISSRLNHITYDFIHHHLFVMFSHFQMMACE